MSANAVPAPTPKPPLPNLPCPSCGVNLLTVGFYNSCNETTRVHEDNRTYIVHQGDKLLDGTIKTIMPTGLVVVQEVNDPLSLVKQREVRKLLRSLEDAKE